MSITEGAYFTPCGCRIFCRNKSKQGLFIGCTLLGNTETWVRLSSFLFLQCMVMVMVNHHSTPVWGIFFNHRTRKSEYLKGCNIYIYVIFSNHYSLHIFPNSVHIGVLILHLSGSPRGAGPCRSPHCLAGAS